MESESKKEPSDFLSQARKFWASLPNAKRIALVLLGALGVACAVALSALGRERLVPLYSGMEPGDAAAVVQKLEAAQIPYELAVSGTTILVPEDRIHKLRLEMAASGLPKRNSVGFELFDKSQFGATEFEQQVNLRRALEGELSRTIATVRGVSGARVHLVLPKNNAFVARKELASASVVVNLENPDLFEKGR